MINLELQIQSCTKDEKALAKCKKDFLIAEVKRHHRVVDLRGLGKWDLIGMILRARYGVKVLKQELRKTHSSVYIATKLV
jgi:hypothetical protein